MDTSQEEQVLLDENKEAEKHEFYMTGALAVSHDNEMLAWAEDTSGDEMFTLHIKNMASGKSLLDTPIEVGSTPHSPTSLRCRVLRAPPMLTGAMRSCCGLD